MILSIYVSICSVFLDKLAARAYVFTHQHGEDLVSLGCVVDRDLL